MPQKSAYKSHKSFSVKPSRRITFKRANTRRVIENLKKENLEAYLPTKERTKELKEKKQKIVNELFDASKNGDDETIRELVRLLNDEESDQYKLQQTKIADMNGYTPLIWASRKNHKKVVAALLQINSYIDAKTTDESGGYTALILASTYGHVEIAEMLLENQANVNIRDAEGNTAIIWACLKGHYDIVELLLENGANINDKDDDGNTAILWACVKGHFNIVELLLENGADFTISENSGETPFMHACSNGHLNIVELILSRIPPEEREALINITDNAGHSALYWACTNGHKYVVRFLVAHGAVGDCDELLNSPVHEGGKTRKLKRVISRRRFSKRRR